VGLAMLGRSPKMRYLNYTKTTARLVFPLLVISISSFTTSCEQKVKQTSNSIEQEEYNQILQVNKKNKDFIKRLDENFPDDGYTFSLIYPSFDESNISELANSQPMLIFDNITGKVSAPEMEEKVRKFLGEEEWKKLRIGHMTKSAN
jgi:hypothetical protein